MSSSSSGASDTIAALAQLENLCKSISSWIDHTLPQALYRAPIIDWHHPDDYSQKGIVGLRKFQSTAEAEKDHVAGLVSSPIKVKEFNSNAPHLVAVWHEFQRANWPLCGITQSLDIGKKVPVKVDVVAEGGAEWIKVNTIKESRLLAEFREQDSYVNSDYDSDTSSPGAGPSQPPAPTLSNSLITQGETLLHAADLHPRPAGRSPPRIRMILTRLIRPPEGFADDRIDQTIIYLEKLGIIAQLGPSFTPILTTTRQSLLRPTKNIVLDLSVLVALCCDSTHYPLPSDDTELESRFRSLRLDGPSGPAQLGEHSNTSKDLRDQLLWEAEHPLIQELKDRLSEVSEDDGRDLRFWITEEVRDRLPGLVDIIGGPAEQKRGKALLRDAWEVSGFWKGSRWEGNEGVLGDIRVQILRPELNDLGSPLSTFQQSLTSTCQSLLYNFEHPPPPDSIPAGKKKPPRRSRSRPSVIFPTSRSPSGHTIRTMLAAARLGWTVLSNNRGAVGKVGREAGVGEGLSWVSTLACGSDSAAGETGGAENGVRTGDSREEVAAIWVVNPSSLSEWRRLEVLRENEKVESAVCSRQDKS